MADAATYTAASAAGGPYGLAAVAAVDLFKSLGISIKGKTKHLSYNQALTPAVQLGGNIGGLLQSNLTSSQYAQLNSSLNMDLYNWMKSSNWWKGGNDVSPLQFDAVKNFGAGNFVSALQNFFIWTMTNAPSDNQTDFVSASREGLNATLFTYLNNWGAQALATAIDAIISGQTSQLQNQKSTTTGGNWLSNLFGGNQTTTGPTTTGGNTTTQASLVKVFAYAIVAIIIVGLFTSPGKKAVAAVTG